MERAYDDAKFGRAATDPIILGLIPSVMDPAMAPPGKHIMSCNIWHAPVTLAEGSWETERDRFGNRVRDGGTAFLLELLLVDDETKPALVGSVIDHGDGRYSGRYTCPDAGRHALSLTHALDGAALYGSPFLLLVGPAEPCANRCEIVAPTRRPQPTR